MLRCKPFLRCLKVLTDLGEALTCRGSSWPFRKYPPLQVLLLECIVPWTFGFQRKKHPGFFRPCNPVRRGGLTTPAHHTLASIPAQPNSVTELSGCHGHPWKSGAAQNAVLGPDRVPQFQRDILGGQPGLGSAHGSHACVLRLNRALDAGV